MEVITRDLLSLVMVITMDMDNLMSTRTVIIIMDMARGLLSLVMALHMFMWSRRTMDMATQSLMSMDTTFIRGLLNLVMVITMDMDNLMSTRTVIIIMDLTDMRSNMTIRRDLLRLD